MPTVTSRLANVCRRYQPSPDQDDRLERGDYVPREKDNWDSRAVNPALTIMANALRVGDHLLERLH